MSPLDLANLLREIFGDFHYVAAFTVLLLCGVGLPLPEEVTLLGSGILLYRGDVRFLPIVLVCASAILLGDSAPYWLGRRYGMNALRIGWMRKVLHPERLARLQRRFEEHGNWATFVCRFFPGLRIPGYFVAGSMGLSYVRFLLLDGLGVLLTVPLSIYLGELFGGKIDRLEKHYGDLHLIFAFLALSLVLIMVVRHWRSKRNGDRLDAEEALAAVEPTPEDRKG